MWLCATCGKQFPIPVSREAMGVKVEDVCPGCQSNRIIKEKEREVEK